MATFEFSRKDLFDTENLIEKITGEIHRDTDQVQTTFHKHGRRNPQDQLTQYTLQQMTMNVPALRGDESTARIAESTITSGFAPLWEEISTLPGLSAILGDDTIRTISSIEVTGATATGTATAGDGSNGVVSTEGWTWPVRGAGVSLGAANYGEDRGSHAHAGEDFSLPVGSKVYAAKAGKVSKAGVGSAGVNGGYGNYIDIDHEPDKAGGLLTRYAHLSKFLVEVGDTVEVGQHIADSGNTGRSSGPHIHFEIRVVGSDGATGLYGFSGTKDPMKYLPEDGWK